MSQSKEHDKDNMKFLHTMLRVTNLPQSIDFYTQVLGMSLLRTTQRPEQKYDLAFLGYGKGNQEGFGEIELTYNYGVDHYEPGGYFGHIAIGVEDVYKTCEMVKEMGCKVTREAGPVKGGNTIIAFIEDKAGRNNQGRITVRRRGAGVSKHIRNISWDLQNPDQYKIELIGLSSFG